MTYYSLGLPVILWVFWTLAAILLHHFSLLNFSSSHFVTTIHLMLLARFLMTTLELILGGFTPSFCLHCFSSPSMLGTLVSHLFFILQSSLSLPHHTNHAFIKHKEHNPTNHHNQWQQNWTSNVRRTLCIPVWGGDCKVEIVNRINDMVCSWGCCKVEIVHRIDWVCASLNKFKDGCVEISKFLFKNSLALCMSFALVATCITFECRISKANFSKFLKTIHDFHSNKSHWQCWGFSHPKRHKPISHILDTVVQGWWLQHVCRIIN